ncbi:hypothetical protein AVV30_gp021 [Vibrio phage phi 1]|uniref:Uncharacterized protein n=1 Tax=Vibrio phage phi 1 TaxID=1589297 RepID=A0A0B5HAD6_9CAUD|nr:hypothetical protein AVV30_gp021 [Vibrio phage phi 1]AJF40679.1 hypothetical protein SBVP1_0021 [Vibrio phage phi 1]
MKLLSTYSPALDNDDQIEIPDGEILYTLYMDKRYASLKRWPFGDEEEVKTYCGNKVKRNQ